MVAGVGAALLLLAGIATPAAAADKETRKLSFRGSEPCAAGKLLWQAKGQISDSIVGETADGQAFLASSELNLTQSFSQRGEKFTITLHIDYLEETATLVSPDDPRLDGMDVIGPVYDIAGYQSTDVEVRTADGSLDPTYSQTDVRQDSVDLVDTLGDYAPGGEYLDTVRNGEPPLIWSTDWCDMAADILGT